CGRIGVKRRAAIAASDRYWHTSCRLAAVLRVASRMGSLYSDRERQIMHGVVFRHWFGRLLAVSLSFLACTPSFAVGPGKDEKLQEKPVFILAGHGDGIFSVAFSPDGSSLASASRDRTIKLWDMATGQVIRTLKGHDNQVLRSEEHTSELQS